jgi:hypothetical protein
MVAFAVAVVFFLVACAIVLLGDVIFKPHNSNEEVSDSLILTQPPILLPYEKRFTEDGVPLSHVDMANGGNSLFDSRSPNSAILEEIFGDTEKDSQRFDGLISTWKDLHLSLEEKKK